jgi:uncharacterized protein (UPF0332 family)
LSPQAEQFLVKAQSLLAQARSMMTIPLPDAVGRNAYLAAFHAAQALIFERNGRVAKTHRGVQPEFLRLTRDDPRVDRDLRAFLSTAYDLKAVADYEIGPDAVVPLGEATEALRQAEAFVTHLAAVAASRPG